MAIAAVGLGACDDRRPQPLTIDNALTADEIAAGRLTPEVMWKMSRAGSSSLSPDGKTLLYAQTDYNMAQNRGVTTIWVQDMASGAVTRLTDTASNNALASLTGIPVTGVVSTTALLLRLEVFIGFSLLIN